MPLGCRRAGDGIAGNGWGWWLLLPSLPGQQQTELGPAEAQGLSRKPKCLPIDLGAYCKNKAAASSGRGKAYDIQFHSFFEKLSYIFLEKVGAYNIFHLYGLFS